MVLAESGLNTEQVSLMMPIYIEKCILVLKQVVLIERVVLILGGLYSKTTVLPQKIKPHIQATLFIMNLAITINKSVTVHTIFMSHLYLTHSMLYTLIKKTLVIILVILNGSCYSL